MQNKAKVVSAWLGLALAFLAIGAYRLAFGALGAVLDTRPAGVALAVLGVALAVVGLRGRGEATTPRGHRAIGLATLLIGVLAACLLGQDMLFAYRSEEVLFSSGKVLLSGTLYLPRSTGAPYPAVVLTHGAGEETRSESAFYARMFARHGIAGLAYDKRGSGESSGDLESATYEDLAADALAAVRHLEGRPDIDRRRIGYKGTSEGGWVAPIAAAAPERPAFVILVSTTAETPAQQVRYEVGERVRRAGFDEEVAARASELYGRLSQFERTGTGREKLDQDFQRAAGEPWFEAAGYLPAKLPPYEEVQELSWFPAWRSRMDFDAAGYLSRVNCPVLLLLGEHDPKMSSVRATETVRAALAAGGNSDLTVQVFPRSEHGLVEWYLPGRMPPPRFPDGYPELMADWVVKVVGRD